MGRAAFGHRRVLPTIIEIIGIGTAAAIAGVGNGKLVGQLNVEHF